jgi:hypothetical protein
MYFALALAGAAMLFLDNMAELVLWLEEWLDDQLWRPAAIFHAS